MDVRDKNTFCPDYAIAPGETLAETLESLGMTQAELAEKMGRPKKTINEIIKGKSALTPETAIQLERVLGIPAHFWNNLEKNYREDLARIEEHERLKEAANWLEELPVIEMRAAGWIDKDADEAETADQALRVFGVGSVKGWRTIWGKLIHTPISFAELEKQIYLRGASAWLQKRCPLVQN